MHVDITPIYSIFEKKGPQKTAQCLAFSQLHLPKKNFKTAAKPPKQQIPAAEWFF